MYRKLGGIMQKIKLKIKMISDSCNENNYEGIFNSDIISYKEDKTKVEVDLNNSIITRNDEEKLLVVDYRREVIHLNLKGYDYKFDMPIECINEEKREKFFSIKYKLEDKIIEYILEYEEI